VITGKGIPDAWQVRLALLPVDIINWFDGWVMKRGGNGSVIK